MKPSRTAEPSFSSPDQPEPVAEALRPFGRRLAAIFAVSSACLIAAGFLYLSREQTAARHAAQQELSAIADLKLTQLTNWRAERLADARFISRAPNVAQDVRRFLDDPTSQPAREGVAQWLNLLKAGDRYYAAILFDAGHNPVLALPGTTTDPAPAVRHYFDAAVQSRDVIMGELHRDQTNGPIHLDLIAPVFPNADSRQPPMAIVMFKLDALHFLFPVVQSWPTPSRTSETLLVRRDGDDVLFLNELRQRPGTALTLRQPLSSPSLPAAKVVRGETNAFEGIDYRGVKVVAVGRHIPGTAWGMVAKEDREEIYAPLRRQAITTGLVMAGLLAMNTLLIIMVWKQRNTRFIERELSREKEHVAQLHAHQLEIQRLSRLYAALSQVNQAVVRTTSRDELLREVCRVLIEFGDLQMACVVGRNNGESTLVPWAFFGKAPKQGEAAHGGAPDLSAAQDLLGAVMEAKRPWICNDVPGEAEAQPWRGEAVRAGWHSLAVFPICDQGTSCAALAVFAQPAGFFGTNEQALLTEAASDIAFGLEVFARDQRRREAEEKSRLQASVMEAAANAIVITGIDGIIQWVNPAFERLTGYSAATAIGRNPRMLKSSQHQQAFYETMWQTILGGKVWHGEVTNRRRDGTFFTEEMTITPVRNAAGDITHFVAIKQDISERKRADDALREARDQLARANAGLEERVKERTALLHESIAELEAFSYSLTHDLRAPLRAVHSFSSLILEEHGPKIGDDGAQMLRRIVNAAERMDQLITDVLALSRVSRVEMRMESVDLDTLVRHLLQERPELDASRAEVRVQSPLAAVLAHEASLTQCLTNLLNNAVKFVAPGVRPSVRVWTEPAPGTKGWVRLWVEDNGIGIAPESREKVFEIFQRLHQRHEYEGTGIGLAIVRKAVERMNGHLGLESEVGQGSRFWVELPQAPAKERGQN